MTVSAAAMMKTSAPVMSAVTAQAASLGDVPGIDVTPGVPFAQMRVGPVVWEPLVLRGLTDRGEAKPDERDPGPPCELPSHLLAKDL